jgi:hypothetical protein
MSPDLSVIEAASWRLASELVRRHPDQLKLIRSHPGGGQYDCLTIWSIAHPHRTIQLNRLGRIHMHGPSATELADWSPTDWADYLAADPRQFLERLERAAGLPTPGSPPPATPTTLTYRVLAAIAVSGFKSVHPVTIEQGYIDSSGGSGPNRRLDAFPIDSDRLVGRGDDLFQEARYRFWMVVRDGRPLIAIDQADASAWTRRRADPLDLMAMYKQSERRVLVTALDLLRAAEA